MLRVIVNASASGAKSYYSSGLAREDYYTKGREQEFIGEWGGNAAQKLGLEGRVEKEQFAALCDNLHPGTLEQLTARQNENRRVGYDLNFHAPKSISIVYGITGDENIMKAFRDSVKETMTEIEKDMQVRVRTGGKNENRTTGNLVYGEFIHTTSRPVDGVPDPHLHAHCFTFNASYDAEQQMWKAGEFGKIKKDAAYFEACFHSSFAAKLDQMGYPIEKTKNGWELSGVNRDTILKFSNRTLEVEREAQKKGITDARAKDQIGARTRDKKSAELSYEDLIEKWRDRLTENENQTIETLGQNRERAVEKKNRDEKAQQAVDLTLDHIFERKSVSSEREILGAAMKQSYGTCTPKSIHNAYEQKDKKLIKAENKGDTVVTTKEAVSEERMIVTHAAQSKGTVVPLNPDYKIQSDWLNKEQRDAIKYALRSNDQLILIEGGAGTGKTTLMKEIKTGIEQGGKQIISFAPSAEASRGVLQSEGFENADTVARLLVDEKLQKQVNGQVLWIDESGLLGNKQMNGVMQIAKEQNARLILTGDTRQHNSVERGDAMRILLEKSGVAPIRVNEIQRQRNAPTYKQAVKYISEQKLEKGFDALERMGAIREIEGAEVRHSTIAKDYVQATQKGQSVLVVAPTHREGEQVTNSIRKELKASGKLDKKDRMFTTQKNAGFTEAQKKDPALYHEGLALQFHQNAKGIKRGQIFDVVGGDAKGGILIQDINDMNAKPRQLPFEQASKFSVFEKRQLPLSKGDQIRITQNGFSRDNHRLNNGNMAQVTGFDKNGNIQVSTGKRSFTLDKEHRNFTSGYCATSHASQGKTVDRVLIAQSSASAAAASKEQFYVSVSRGRKGVTVYTDNKQELKDSVGKSGQRKTAMEVAMQADKNKTPLQNQQKHVSRLATFARVKYERMRAIVGKMMFGKK